MANNTIQESLAFKKTMLPEYWNTNENGLKAIQLADALVRYGLWNQCCYYILQKGGIIERMIGITA